MPAIVACYKWVPDEEGIRIGDDRSVDISRARWEIGSFDRSAIEAAVQAAEASGWTPVTLTYGGEGVEKSLKDALSRGPEKGYWVASDQQDRADGRATSKVLAASVHTLDDVRLVVCAEGASDTYARQVGPRLGVCLGWPTVTSVLSFELGEGSATVVRKLEDTVQTVEVQLPCVLCVLPEGFEPRVPGLKAIMAANRKPKERIDAADLGADEAPLAERVSLEGFAMARKNLVIAEDDPAVAARELVAALHKEGVLS
jgi:electron transfer flavoprotein beta subunit